MRRQNLFVTLPVCLTIVVASAWLANAGPLNPPSGPVQSTSRFGPRTVINEANTPGDADSLFMITQPGSYYLGGNVTGVSGMSGIEIAASNVSIDLNGFSLTGVPGSLDGIVVNPQTQRNITIKDGIVTSWGQDGIDLGAGGLLVTRIRVRDNGGWGIHANTNSVVTQCTVSLNGAGGILGAQNGLIQNCMLHLNGLAGVGNGIQGGSGFTVIGCQVSQSTGDGIHLVAGSGDGMAAVNVIACTSRRNGGIGIKLATSGLVTKCVANVNGGGGIQATNSLVRGNTAFDNTVFNIDGGGTSTMIENHAP